MLRMTHAGLTPDRIDGSGVECDLINASKPAYFQCTQAASAGQPNNICLTNPLLRLAAGTILIDAKVMNAFVGYDRLTEF